MTYGYVLSELYVHSCRQTNSILPVKSSRSLWRESIYYIPKVIIMMIKLTFIKFPPIKRYYNYLSCVVLMLIAYDSFGQASTYDVTTSSTTYTEITGGTVILAAGATYDDNISALQTINSFTYNGTAVTKMSISSNGWIAIGGTAASTSTSVYTALSSAVGATAANGVIAPFARDQQSATVAAQGFDSEIRWEYLSGSNETVIQWKNARTFGNTTALNYQCRLNHTNNTIQFVYGAMAYGTNATSPQVGIKSAIAAGSLTTTTAGNMISLTLANVPAGTTCTWADAVRARVNTATMGFSTTLPFSIPSGTTFTFAPQSGAATTWVNPVTTVAAATGVSTGGASISWTAPITATGTAATGYNIQYRAVGTCAWTSFSGNPVATTSATLTGLSSATSYQVRIQSQVTASGNKAAYSHPVLGTAANTDGYTATGYFTTLAFPATVTGYTAAGVASNPVCSTGGQTVVLTGTSFTAASTVSFGGTAATGVVVNSLTQITCTAPALASAGTGYITVTNSSASPSATGAGNFFQVVSTDNVNLATSENIIAYNSLSGPENFSLSPFLTTTGSQFTLQFTGTATYVQWFAQDQTTLLGTGNSISINNAQSASFYVTASMSYCSNPSKQVFDIITNGVIPSSNINFTDISANSCTLNWNNGNGNGRVILINTSPINFTPAVGYNPPVVSNYSSFSNPGLQCIYNGPVSGPITISGLNPGTAYYIKIFEFVEPSRTYSTPASGTTNTLGSLNQSAGTDSSPFMLVQNVLTTNNNESNRTIQVQYDLNWAYSWRDDINWDAAWVFMKYRDAQGNWKHCKINSNGFNAGGGTPMTIQVSNDKLGAMIYPSVNGAGNVYKNQMQLQWNYGIDGLTSVAGIEVRVFAVEMVYVPQGDFNVSKRFNGGHILSAPGDNFPVINTRLTPSLNYNDGAEAIIRIKGDAGVDANNDGAVDNVDYPTGYKAFYCYKYELSEQQYADFLNCLTSAQRTSLGVAGAGITLVGNEYFSSTPNKACGNMSINRLLAYADWSGVRPMTILEMNKASYGPLQPGTLTSVYYPVASTYYTNNDGAIGALREVGAYDSGSSTRTSSGSSYYGIDDLTGNAREHVVSLNFLNFNSVNGDGVLDDSGNADVNGWSSSGMLVPYEQFQFANYSSAYLGIRYVRSAE